MTKAPLERVAMPPPLEMQRARQWLLWTVEYRTPTTGPRAGEQVPVKVPYYVTGERRRGDLDNDADRLVSYAEARVAAAMWGYGLGFALGNGWQGVDYDHTDERPELLDLLALTPGYVELSPSGNGYHAIGYGAPFDALGSNPSGIEAYSRGRFFTFTGWCVRPGPIVDLAPHVLGILAPRHAAARRAPGPVAPRPPVAATGDRVLDELADALRFIDADDRDTWVRVGQALYPLGEVGFALWEAWSATSERFPGGDDLERWNSFKGERTGYASVFNQAAAGGWKNPRKLDPAAIFAGSSLVSGGSLIAGPAVATGFPETVLELPAPVAPLARPPGVPPVPDAMPAPAARVGGQDYREADGRQRAASIENVVDAIGPASGLRIVYDTFQHEILLGSADGSHRYAMLTDTDYSRMRVQLGRGGFKPVPLETMKAAVDLVARENQIDTAIEWAKSLVWDGVPRIDRAMSTYYGCEDTPYTRSVSAYLFTALAGRALVPGIQADMALVMVGVQGARKTSAVSALSPSPEFFGEVNLAKQDDDLARRLKGKLVVEWAELRGLAGRDQEGIKAWVSRRTEEWTPKYKEFNTRFSRRCVVIATGNQKGVLDDETGERRWLPVSAGSTDVEALLRDRDQLWAEGVVRFKEGGIEWEVAEALAKHEHIEFKVDDEWSDPIAEWLSSSPLPRLGEIPSPLQNGKKPFPTLKVAVEALAFQARDVTRRESNRIAKILRIQGYELICVREKNKIYKRWVLNASETD